MYESINFLKKIVFSLNHPVIVIENKTGKIQFFTPLARKIFGYSESEFKKLFLSDILIDKKVKQFLEKNILKLNFRKKNGKRFSTYVRVNKFLNKNKYYTSLILIFSKDKYFPYYFIKYSQRYSGSRRSFLLNKDPLTLVLSYKSLMKEFKKELDKNKKGGSDLSLIMMDIDNLDAINETLGIEAGDRVLKSLAELIVKNIRTDDIVGRLGEDSFLIILPQTSKRGAYNLAGRILDSLNSLSLEKGGRMIKVSSTFSIVSFPEDRCRDIGEMLQRAKVLISSAKEMGGNTVAAFNEYINTPELAKDISKKNEYISFQKQLQSLNKKLHTTILETITALSSAVKAKDYYTEKHSEFTAYYAGLLAQKLNLKPEEIETVKIGAVLHDIGKIGISDEILNKPGPLDAKERELINLHPEIGANIIRAIKFLKDIVPIILYHHERYDGKNNRWGLKGKDIPLGARIVSVIDVYHALISERPYRKALSREEAIQIIISESGKMFDPDIVTAFLEIIGEK